MRFAPGTTRFVLPPLGAALLALVVFPPASIAFLVVALAVLTFFRDPERSPPPAGIVSPADGKVSVIREEGEQVRVGVFMNVTDVHVNRAPMDGVVEDVTHRPGAHRPAFTKDSERNERVDVRFERHEVSLIAGWFARRIHPYLQSGQAVERGQRIGHVAFGSRADVLLPPELGREDLLVEVGDRVRAGETVFAPSE
ncbi:MAG: protein sorting system archaetidylserine decarboxylase [Halobacteriota archaeon]